MLTISPSIIRFALSVSALVCGLIAWLGSLYFILFFSSDYDAVAAYMLVPIGLGVAAHGIQIWYDHGRPVLTPPLCVLLALTAWHLSYAFVHAIGMSSDFRVDFVLGSAPDSNVKGLAVCTGGIAAFLLGLVFTWSTRPAIKTFNHLDCGSSNPRLGRVFFGVQIIGLVIIWGYFVLQGRKLVGDYSAVFLEAQPLRQWYNLGVMLILGTLGPALITAGSRRARLTIAVLALVATLPSFFMGSRWVPFSALLICGSVMSLLGWKMRLMRAAVLGVLLLGASIVVKEIRSGQEFTARSVSGFFEDRGTRFLTEFFEEIGSTLLACILTVDHCDNQGIRLYGRTYLDAISTMVPGIKVAERQNSPDHIIAAEYFSERHLTEGFSIGSSVIAELYLNFGVFGVHSGALAGGLLLGWMWRRAFSGSMPWLLISYVVLAFLIFGLRNDLFTWVRPLGRTLGLVGVIYMVWGRPKRLRAYEAVKLRATSAV